MGHTVPEALVLTTDLPPVFGPRVTRHRARRGPGPGSAGIHLPSGHGARAPGRDRGEDRGRGQGCASHLYCTGEGEPAIVLDAGLGDDSLIWGKIQPQLSKSTKVCSYDRAGFGWSDARPGRQDADAISAQLHQLLSVAGVHKPFVLMGHSIAGLYLRSYAAHYPSDLAGLVFVDGATPLQDDRVPKTLVKIQEEQRADMPWLRFLITVGWYRLQGDCTAVPPGLEAYAAWIKADSCVPSQIGVMENELDAGRRSGEQTLHAGPFGSLPVLVLSRDPSVLPSNWPPDVARGNAVVWNIMQDEALQLSTDSRRVIAKGSDHSLHLDRPDVVNAEVERFLTKLRATQASGTWTPAR
ncbi:alpha/beta hydrolase [Stigmatella sp. ncwal1]|uniref:Alpha/beta hydrolase n=2 Tax=Stigmatella ashevillensis TaxID=2995309 RepID=A0ABT5DAW0_9BACT|nr:alpha/beta hydrolase [Stigmatella ashevillena]